MRIDLNGVLGLLGALLAAVAFCYTAVQRDIETQKVDRWIQWLENPPLLRLYRGVLRAVLRRLQEVVGTPFTNRSLSFNTNLAVFYSFAAFLVIWVFTGSGRVGTYEILDEHLSPGSRFITLMLFSGLVILTVRILTKPIRVRRRISRIRTFIARLFIFAPALSIAILLPRQWLLHVRPTKLLETALILGLAGTLSGAILGLACSRKGARKGYGPVVFAATYITLVCGASATSAIMQFHALPLYVSIPAIAAGPLAGGAVVLILRTVGGAWTYLLNIVLVAATVVVKHTEPTLIGMDDVSSTLLYFFVLLPSANGLLDWLSLSTSRALAKRMLTTDRITTIVGHIFVDLIAAFLVLAMLVVVLVAGTTLYDRYVVREAAFVIPVASLIDATRAHPLGRDGLWVTVMLFSTLVPTFCHMVLAVAGLMFTYGFHGLQLSLARALRAPDVTAATTMGLSTYVVLVDATSVIITGTVVGGIIAAVHPFLSDFLYDVASYTHRAIG